jgi:hypothetical protein
MLRTRICWPLPATQIKSPGSAHLEGAPLVARTSLLREGCARGKDAPGLVQLGVRVQRIWKGRHMSRTALLWDGSGVTSLVACHVALLVVDFSSTFSFLFDANCPSGLEAVPLPRSPKPLVMIGVVPHSPPLTWLCCNALPAPSSLLPLDRPTARAGRAVAPEGHVITPQDLLLSQSVHRLDIYQDFGLSASGMSC